MTKVQVLLGNRKALFVRPYPDKEITDLLKYRMPGWEYTPAAKYNGWDGYIGPIKYGAMWSGAFLAYKKKMEDELGLEFVIEDQRKAFKLARKLEDDEVFTSKARKYQKECVEALIATNKTGGLILNATGTGKTFCAGLYFRQIAGNVLFVVDELTLLNQAQKEIEKVSGEQVGEIGNMVVKPRRITVATIQTLHRHRQDPEFIPWIRSLQVMIIDELHLALNRRNFQTVRAYRPPVVVGLTATLEMRKKNVAVRAHEMCGPILYSYPLMQGVREGFLSKGVAICVEVRNNWAAPKFAGQGGWWKRRQFYRERYPEEYQALIVEGVERNQAIVDLVKQAHKKDKYVILLAERVAHLKELSQAFKKIDHDIVIGERAVEDRIESKAQFERGQLRLLLASKIFTKGVDIKRVDVVIDAAGLKSKNNTQQKYGRGVRLCDGKQGLIYIDIGDIGNRFEKAAKSRRAALKKLGIPVYKVDSELGAERILELAEKKLRKQDG